MKLIGDILSIILIIVFSIGGLWGFFYLIARASKFTGKTYVLKGGRVTPQTFDAMTEQLENNKRAVSSSVNYIANALIDKIKKDRLLNGRDLNRSKLENLEILTRLRQDGSVTEEEFNDMKREILK